MIHPCTRQRLTREFAGVRHGGNHAPRSGTYRMGLGSPAHADRGSKYDLSTRKYATGVATPARAGLGPITTRAPSCTAGGHTATTLLPRAPPPPVRAPGHPLSCGRARNCVAHDGRNGMCGSRTAGQHTRCMRRWACVWAMRLIGRCALAAPVYLVGLCAALVGTPLQIRAASGIAAYAMELPTVAHKPDVCPA